MSKKSFRHAAKLFETSKSFKKLFDPTRKGTLTVHLRAKCRRFADITVANDGPAEKVAQKLEEAYEHFSD